MKSSLLFVALILYMSSARADLHPLVSINDPAGDDYGAGTLIYPKRADFQVGDLDLLQMQIRRDKEGFWFEAIFKNPIHDPGNIPNAVGGESLAEFARKGFYQFNIDIYVDTDRVKGSGNAFTLPGRQVRIDSDYAWEKAVILSPRPELMRQQLLGALSEQYPDRTTAELGESVDHSIFFPSRIRVRGKSIAFFVPASFFAGSDGTDWAITALVTGALTTIPADFSLFPSSKKPLERLPLGVMQPAAGHPKDTFGYSGSTPSPVVDLLAPSTEQQVRQLAAKNDLTGVAWGAHATESAMPVASGKASVPDAGAAAATPGVPVGILFNPGSQAAKPAESSPAEAEPIAGHSIAKRLQILQQLFDQKLIDENEYKQQKQRILKEL